MSKYVFKYYVDTLVKITLYLKNPTSSFADLYNQLTISAAMIEAVVESDKVVDGAYSK